MSKPKSGKNPARKNQVRLKTPVEGVLRSGDTRKPSGPKSQDRAQSPKQQRPLAADRAAAADLRRRSQWVLAGILALTAIVYLNSLSNGFIEFDDPESVTQNFSIRAISGDNINYWFSAPLQFMYTPLTYASYAADYLVGGDGPGVYHFTNLVLHLANVALVFEFFRRLSRRPVVATVVAVLFAIHPINVDSVAWVSTRSNLLMTFFVLISMILYLKYVDDRSTKALWWAALAFLGAALSKSPAVVLPVVLVLIDIYRERQIRLTLLTEKVAFWAISLVIGLVALGFRGDKDNLWDYKLFDQLMVILSAMMGYLGKLVAPFNLAFAYAYPPKVDGSLPWWVYVSPLVIAAVIGLLWLLKIPWRVLLFGFGFFVINASISQTAILIDNYQSNRYAYLSFLGLFFVVAVIVDRLWSWVAESAPETTIPRPSSGKAGVPPLNTLQMTGVGLAVLMIGVMSVLTFQRTFLWKDTITLFTDSLEQQPEVPFVWNNRGIAKFNLGDYAGAEADLNQALELHPNFSLAYYYLGKVEAAKGNEEAAIALYDDAINRAPGMAYAYTDRAHSKVAVGDYQGALDDFSQTVEMAPLDPDPLYNRGVMKLYLEDLSGACDDWRVASNLGFFLADQALLDNGC